MPIQKKEKDTFFLFLSFSLFYFPIDKHGNALNGTDIRIELTSIFCVLF